MKIISRLLGEKCYICRQRDRASGGIRMARTASYGVYSAVSWKTYHASCLTAVLADPEHWESWNPGSVDRALHINDLKQIHDHKVQENDHNQAQRISRALLAMNPPEPVPEPEPEPEPTVPLVIRPRRAIPYDINLEG